MHYDSSKPLGIRICSTLMTKMWSLKKFLSHLCQKHHLIHLLHPTGLRLKAFNQQFQKMLQLKHLLMVKRLNTKKMGFPLMSNYLLSMYYLESFNFTLTRSWTLP
ncbi:uncharacterized protein LOC128041191 [Gossypium raimondii]|uniref:uncharacterized protein LOC128041191 n=1 Tax=Gossypium raimondii TaxID=29730 RepID=UPI00227C2B4B|nr:uncharacterized protein LOC128041191 [Gossypium raimondii]